MTLLGIARKQPEMTTWNINDLFQPKCCNAEPPPPPPDFTEVRLNSEGVTEVWFLQCQAGVSSNVRKTAVIFSAKSHLWG